jgi:hypothetical protein
VQLVLQHIANPTKILQKRKERDERKQTLAARIYPVVSVDTKTSLFHVVEALTKSIAVTLMPLSLPTSHEGGVSLSPHKTVVATPR